jgi:tetratricopeptide (TPR) repeat protein
MLKKLWAKLRNYSPRLANRNVTPRLVLAAMAALILELFLSTLLLSNFLPFLGFALSHLSLVLLLAFYADLEHKSGNEWGHALLLAATTLTMGPIGPAGMLLFLLLNIHYLRSSLTFQEWYDSLFPQEETSFTRKLHEEIELAGKDIAQAEPPVPFVEFMRAGSSRQKQTVIALIAKDFKPVFAKTLLLALRDESNAIRVQAATTMARIENQFLEETLRLKEALEKDPDDEDLLLTLARHYDDYAFTGLLDSSREEKNREEAKKLYQRCLRHNPDNQQIQIAVGRILVREQRREEARDWLITCLERGDVSPQLILWLAESEFQLKEWQTLRQRLRENSQLLLDADLPDQLLNVLELWNNGRSNAVSEKEQETA